MRTKWIPMLLCPFVAFFITMTAVGAEEESAEKKKPDFTPIEEVVKEAKKLEGFLTLYKKGDTDLFAEISADKLNKPFLISISLARGTAQGYLMAGMTIGNSLFYWKDADKKVFLIEKNVHHTANSSDPINKAVEEGFQDSIIAAFPVKAKTGGNILIDMSDFLFTDYPEFGSMLGGYSIDTSRTTWGLTKNFPMNTEIEVNATYRGRGDSSMANTVPDPRSVSIVTRYSFSQVPNTGYKKRVADDRIGYFLTAQMDYSMKTSREPFQRFVHRWNLQKADPSAEMSPPKKPIVFYIDKNVPYEYRPAVQAGILEWNKAFEKAGFINAIEVRFQEDDAEWDAEDVRYNTVRWMTGEAGFAIGPSRANPETGEIYDADVLVDSGWLNYFQWQYETTINPSTPGKVDYNQLSEKNPQNWQTFVNQLRGVPGETQNPPAMDSRWKERLEEQRCEYAAGFRQQLCLAAVADLVKGATPSKNGVLQDFLYQGLKNLITHEVGHTLGLRHNFKSSAMIALKDLFDKEKAEKQGLIGSVMDYDLCVIAPPGQEQGYYFSPTVGAYDLLAIQYGYKECSDDDLKKLAATASQSPYLYGTDGDVGLGVDPLTQTRDMSDDPIAWADMRVKVYTNIWKNLSEKVVKEGDNYNRLRDAFMYTLSGLNNDLYHAASFVGGIYISRDHKGDPEEDPTFKIVPAAKQREALRLVCDVTLKGDIFKFDPELISRLGPNLWDHWGSSGYRGDVDIHYQITIMQLITLSQLMNYEVLTRVHNSPYYLKAEEEAITIDEIYRSVTDAIFAELKKDPKSTQWTAANPFVEPQRRDLQRMYLKFFLLQDLLLDPTTSTFLPQDVLSTSRNVTLDLRKNVDSLIQSVNDGSVSLDPMSLAHLREVQTQLAKSLEANMQAR